VAGALTGALTGLLTGALTGALAGLEKVGCDEKVGRELVEVGGLEKVGWKRFLLPPPKTLNCGSAVATPQRARVRTRRDLIMVMTTGLLLPAPGPLL
jgi:hypothetical protein